MRTFDDIIPPSRRKDDGALRPNVPPDVRRPGPRGGPRRRRFPYVTAIGALVVVGGCIVALLHFSSAKVSVVPTTSSATVSGTYTAGGPGAASGDLSYQILTAKKVATQNVAASGTKTVSTSASGSMTIYNTQSKAQKLIANTRFASAAGLIFRIHSSVTVPPGTTAKPGSAVVTVFADAPGPSYNIDATSFTVPGLAGTPEASAVYGRSSAAMSGGASGPVAVVDAATEKAAMTALQGSLAPDLTTSIQSQVPEGYLLLPGATATTYRELSTISASSTGKATLQEEGTITAVVFPATALAKAIAISSSASDYQKGGVTLAPATSLTLTSSSIPSSNSETFSFTLAGTAALVSTIDPMQIATAVAGKTRAEAQVALTSYPEIKSAILILRPFWRQSFPEDPASITVTVATPATGAP